MTQSDAEKQFVQLLTEHQTKLRAFVHSLLPDWHAAEDVLQETNGVLWEKAKDYELGTNFIAWSFAIAHNQVRLARLRFSREKQRLSDGLVDQLAQEAVDRFSSTDSRREALQSCYEKLDVDDRRLMGQRYTEKASLSTIAEASRKSLGAIRQTLYRIRQRLSVCIERTVTGKANQ